MSVEASVRITNPTGLHARPAVKLAQLAAGFKADVRVRVNDEGDWVKARSTSRVLKLKARRDATIYFKADGEDASQALDALIDFVRRDFGEGGQRSQAGQTDNAAAQKRTIAATDDQVWIGESASEGLVTGVTHKLRAELETTAGYEQGSVDEERAALDNALAAALQDLAALRGQPDSLDAGVIDFQLALLGDKELLDPVRRAVDSGDPALDAWLTHLKVEAADYENAEDDYFRGRAADLLDFSDRVARHLLGKLPIIEDFEKDTVLIVDELTPSRFLEIDWSRCRGVATLRGSSGGHAAMLARARGIPMLIGVRGDIAEIPPGVTAVLDAQGSPGRLVVAPADKTLRHYRKLLDARAKQEAVARSFVDRPAETSSGQKIRLLLNVDEPAVLDNVSPDHCDGIGLTRTEFLFQGLDELPDEDRQYGVYRHLLEWARGKPVTIRTLDAGGDKSIAALTQSTQDNTFMGLRGLRLSLQRPEIFSAQLRALARAAAHGPLRVMAPMVTIPAELDQAKALMASALQQVCDKGQEAAMPRFGMMVEVPAAAIGIENFNADFFSIGSNDLTQYTLAVARDVPEVSHLYDTAHPAVIELIRHVVDHCREQRIEVSLCGEVLPDSGSLAPLIGAGLGALSVPPAMLGRVKAALAQV
ncbi:MAG: phosphoenolpyruvate--protein phosphotransferase [Gammaproteobacteria bacterium]